MGLIRRQQEFGKTISSQSISQDATTATALTVPTATTVQSALVSVWGPCSFRTDGTSPTATVGHTMAANASVEIFGDDVRTFEIISQSGTVAVFVTYLGE